MTVEILHDCGDFQAGTTHRLSEKHAQRLIRTGYARPLESAVVTPQESAMRPPKLRKTVQTETRG